MNEAINWTFTFLSGIATIAFIFFIYYLVPLIKGIDNYKKDNFTDLEPYMIKFTNNIIIPKMMNAFRNKIRELTTIPKSDINREFKQVQISPDVIRQATQTAYQTIGQIPAPDANPANLSPEFVLSS